MTYLTMHRCAVSPKVSYPLYSIKQKRRARTQPNNIQFRAKENKQRSET